MLVDVLSINGLLEVEGGRLCGRQWGEFIVLPVSFI